MELIPIVHKWKCSTTLYILDMFRCAMFFCKMFWCAMFFLANCARVVIPNAITGDRRFCCKNLTKHENSTPRLNLIFAIQVLQFHLFVQPTDCCWISEYLDHFQNQHSWAPKPKPDKPEKITSSFHPRSLLACAGHCLAHGSENRTNHCYFHSAIRNQLYSNYIILANY